MARMERQARRSEMQTSLTHGRTFAAFWPCIWRERFRNWEVFLSRSTFFVSCFVRAY